MDIHLSVDNFSQEISTKKVNPWKYAILGLVLTASLIALAATSFQDDKTTVTRNSPSNIERRANVMDTRKFGIRNRRSNKVKNDGLKKQAKKAGKKAKKAAKKAVEKGKQIIDPGHWVAPLGIPSIPFRDFYFLARAPYQDDPLGWLKEKGYANYFQVSSTRVRGWRLLIFADPNPEDADENQENLRLHVAFRGTMKTSASNWKQDFDTIVGKPKVMKNIADSFENAILEAIQTYPAYKLFSFSGHSAGGWFADHSMTDKKVWRVTLNALKARNGDYNINLRSKADPASVWPYSKKNRYLSVTEGAHTSKAFRPLAVPAKGGGGVSQKLGKLPVIELPE